MRMRLIIVALISAVALGTAAVWLLRPAHPQLEMAGLQWFDPPVPLPEQGLEDTGGAPFQWAWPQGWTVAFFGYTHCPDVCPDTLAVLARAESDHSDLPPHRLVFVSVDPYRDDPETLRGYLAYFDAGIQGVTGTPEALQAVAQAAGAFFDYEDPESGAVIPVPDEAAIEKGYTVNHFGALVLVGPDGRMYGHLYLPLTPEKVGRLIQALE